MTPNFLNMLGTGGMWGLTSMVPSLMFFWAMYQQFIPYHLRVYVEKYFVKMIGWIFGWISDYVHIKFSEYTEEGLKRSQAYDSIRNYLASKSMSVSKRLKANESKDSKLVFSVDDYEEIEDEFQGVKVKWYSKVNQPDQNNNGGNNNGGSEKRFFTLSFHRRHRGTVIGTYLDHVLSEGKAIGLNNRERKLYTNKSSGYSWKAGKWNSIPFHHPATFETLAMDPVKKEEIKKDLIKFSKGRDYYKKVGKAWKRGYLLFGPPGTGKSTMIAAIANFLDYDVYDIELTSIDDNSELKKLLLNTKGKSIIVIEDIDCSINLTGQRKKKKDEDEDEEEDGEKSKKGEEKQSKVTLSGLLNSIDGLWSACCGEKIIVFTTNFVDKLDPALIRRGRMDNHIEMSYCRFEGFKVLAKNYLEIETHDLYGEIEKRLEETNISPADVAETLMPKSDEEDADICIKRLVKTLEDEKKKAKKLAEEEEKKKAEKEAKKKKKAEEKKKEAEEGKEENGTFEAKWLQEMMRNKS